MFRTSLQIGLVLVSLAGIAAVPAAAAQVQPTVPAVAAPLAALSDCPGMSRAAAPAAAPIYLQTLSPATTCTGCSGHNCFFKAPGSRCSLGEQRGICRIVSSCPELRETSCTCDLS